MYRIALPDIDDVKLWDEIVSAKKRERREKLLQCRQQVLERYTFYQTHYSALEEIAPLLWEDERSDLQSCYGENAAFSGVRKKLLSSALKCPYCLLNRPNTLDHYFDKSDYPEYSVFTPILIPCCSECNMQKGTRLFDDSRQRQFIHFYLDYIPDYQYLFVRLVFDPCDPVPQVSVELQFPADEPLERQIRSHFSQLELLRKYREAIIARLPTVLKEIESAKSFGWPLEQIREMIQIEYHARVETYKRNYWETCMYEGLLSSEGFLDAFFCS